MASTPKKKRSSTVDPNETPSARFSRLASKRVTKADKAIRNIGSLSARSYQRTPEQVKAILTYLKDAVDFVEGCFSAPGKSAGASEIKI